MKELLVPTPRGWVPVFRFDDGGVREVCAPAWRRVASFGPEETHKLVDSLLRSPHCRVRELDAQGEG